MSGVQLAVCILVMLLVHQPWLLFVTATEEEPTYDITRGFIGAGFGTAFSVSRDTKYYAVASDLDFSLNVYNVADGELQVSFLGFGKNRVVKDFVFSDDGKFLASAASEGDMIKIHDRVKERTHRELQKDGINITTLSNFFSNDKYIAAGCNDSSVLIWDVANSKIVKQLRFNSGPIYTLTVDRDGTQMFFNLENTRGFAVSELRLSDSSENQATTYLKMNIEVPCDHARAGRLHKNWFIIGCADFTARLYDVETRTLKSIFKHDIPGFSFAFAEEKDVLVTASFDATVKLWDLNTFQLIDSLPWTVHSYPVRGVGISSDGSVVITLNRDVVRLWRPKYPTKKDQTEQKNEACASTDAKTAECSAGN